MEASLRARSWVKRWIIQAAALRPLRLFMLVRRRYPAKQRARFCGICAPRCCFSLSSVDAPQLHPVALTCTRPPDHRVHGRRECPEMSRNVHLLRVSRVFASFARRTGEYPPQHRNEARNRSKLSAAIAHNAEDFAGLRAPIDRRLCQVQAPCKAHRLTWGRGAVFTWEGQPAPV